MAVASAATDPANCIAFQGASGAYGDLACRTAYPDMATLPCDTFEETFNAARDGRAALAMIAIDNSLAGRVADVHHLMPESGLHIIGEHFQRSALAPAPKGATLQTSRPAQPHPRRNAEDHQRACLKAIVHADTAAPPPMWRSRRRRKPRSPELAGQIYGLAACAATSLTATYHHALVAAPSR
jgi:prephenate dehydratase